MNKEDLYMGQMRFYIFSLHFYCFSCCVVIVLCIVYCFYAFITGTLF